MIFNFINASSELINFRAVDNNIVLTGTRQGRLRGWLNGEMNMRAFFSDESGATAIEYTLIMTLMAVGLLAAMPLITDGLISDANKIANILK